MSKWPGPKHATTWRYYIETSLLLETRLDEDLRRNTGLSLIDYHVLLLLSESPGHRLRMGELAARMVFRASRVTYQVKSMEKRELAVRQQSGEDKRGSYAVLTASGLEALRDAAPQQARTVRTLFTDELDDDELEVIGKVFSRLWHRLKPGEESADRGLDCG